VALMPIDERLGLPDDRGIPDGDYLGGGACVVEMAESGQRSMVRGIAAGGDVEREYRPVAIKTQKDTDCPGVRDRVRDVRRNRPSSAGGAGDCAPSRSGFRLQSGSMSEAGSRRLDSTQS